MADLWSDYTDSLIDTMDKDISAKYKMRLRDLLTDPGKYADQPNIGVTISNMKEDANKQIDTMLAGMQDEVKRLEDDMSKINSITQQLAQNISMQSKQHNVPLIKPVDITRDTGSEDTIVLNSVDSDALKLAEKLIMSSVMVADFSYTYKSYSVGSWFFGGHKNYSIAVYVPENEAYRLELARDELNDLLDFAADFTKQK